MVPQGSGLTAAKYLQAETNTGESMANDGEDMPLCTLRDYRPLGRSGLLVSPLCYGCMNIADAHMASDPAVSRTLIESYMEKGGNFFDTANMYEGGKSEELLGQILGQRRSEIVLATKYSASMRKADPNAGGQSRMCMAQSLDESLKRLGTDHVDLLYVHFWNFKTPVEEVMRSLDDAVRSGKTRYIAVSDTPAWKIAQANTLSSLRGWTSFIGLQTQYSLVERTAERDLFPMCRDMEIGTCHWGTLAQGMLTGKYDHLTPDAAKDLMAGSLADAKNRSQQKEAMGDVDTYRPKAVLGDWNEKNRAIALETSAVAKEIGRTATQVAFNWSLRKPWSTSPIFAVRTQAQLDDVLGSLDFTLKGDHMKRLDDVSKVDLGFPQRWGMDKELRKLDYN